MHAKKAQITLFVLLGLLILVIIIILIMIRNANKKDQAIEGVDTATLEAYLTNCIDNVAENSFITLGAQGGIFDASQSFSMVLEPEGIPMPIAFGLKNNNGFPIRPPQGLAEFQAANVFFEPRFEDPYPWPSTPILQFYTTPPTISLTLSPDSYRENHYDGPLGQFSLPKLCNKKNSVYCGREDFYPLGNFDTRRPITILLEERMEQVLATCLEQDALSQAIGREISTATPNATVTLGEDATIFEVDVALRATGSSSTLSTHTISRSYPVRLLTTYRFVYDILKRESKDPLFAANRRVDNFPLGGGTMSVQQQSLASTGNPNLYLMTITDFASQVENAPWVFRFLIENRKPIIELNEFYADTPSENILKLAISAIDPENDELTVKWKLTSPQGVTLEKIVNDWSKPFEIDLSSITQPINAYINISVSDPAGASDWFAISLDLSPIN